MPEQTPDPFWDPVAQSAFATYLRESLWAYPALESVHLFGLALVFAPILIFDLRVLGSYRDFNIKRLHQTLLPWVWLGFALSIISGTLLFISDAAEFAHNRAFQTKLVLISVAAANAILFQKLLFPRIPGADDTSGLTQAARVSATLSILLWTGIIIAGRLIAYIK